MSLWRNLRDRITGRVDHDLERELRAHLDIEAEEQREAGLPRDEAEYAAQRAFGNMTLVKEDVRRMWGWTSIERFGRDLRHAVRMMRRRPVFTVVAVLSLAVGLASVTAVFSFARAIVLKSLPAPGAERLVIIRQQNEMFGIENCCFPYPFYRELGRHETDFEDILGVNTTQVNLTDREQTERLQAEVVSGNYFRMLGVRPAAGRLLDESDDASEGTGRVCVIGYRLWQERFGGRPDAIGRRVLLNTEPFQIVGVTEPGFAGAALHQPHDLYVPASMAGTFLGGPRDSFGWAQLIARLKPGVRLEQAQARLNVVGKQIQSVTGPKMADRDDFLLRDGTQGIGSKREQFGKPVLLLLLLVGVVLLITCANIAALLLVRSVERTREAGLRVALGASRPALFRQFLLESMLLAAAGGVAGWLLARMLSQVLLSVLGGQGEGLVPHVRPDATLFAFSAAVTLAAGLLFGALPAWRAARTDPMPSIRGVSAGPGKRYFVSGLLISGQIALSLALLFCAGLFVQTLRNLRSVDLGLKPENVAMLHIDLSRTVYGGRGAAQYFEELLRRARELSETRAASLATISVLSGSMQSIVLQIPGFVPANRLQPVTYFTTVSNGYFRTLGIPLLAGRDFTPEDRGSGEGAAIVNEQFARQFFGGDALGKTFSYGGGRTVRVIGVAGSAKFRWIREDPHPVMYIPVTQWSFPQSLFLQVRTSGAPAAVMGRLRALAQEMDHRVPIEQATTLEMQIDQALARERLLAFLSTLLGGVAVMLAAIGLYGVLSFSVTRRIREIGIRIAVGAGRQGILTLVLRESAWMVFAGTAIGVPFALACGTLASSLLFGLEPQDATTAAVATGLLLVVAFTAALFPAWRAARVDPMIALRHE